MSDNSKLVMVVIVGAFAGAALASLTPYILLAAAGITVVAVGAVYVGRYSTTDNPKSEY